MPYSVQARSRWAAPLDSPHGQTGAKTTDADAPRRAPAPENSSYVKGIAEDLWAYPDHEM
jgi:hypothetical protein